MDKTNLIAEAIWGVFRSSNECDSNFEAANIVDGLFAIARGLYAIAKAINEDKERGDT